MNISELHNKFQKSGVNNSPVISDDELKIYKSKLEELGDFITHYPGTVLSLYSEITSVENTIWARKFL